MKPTNIILEGVTGSTAYGLATENSDVDIKGVYLLPTSEVLGINFNPAHTTKDHTDPDWVYHEVGKFMKLVAAGNPTVSELLYLEEYTQLTETGKLLVDNRQIFLSTPAIMNAYRGYALGQARKLSNRQAEGLNGYDSALKNRFAKHSRHLWRLMVQAEELLTTGNLTIKLTEEQREACFAFGELPPDKVVDGFISMDNHVKSLEASSVLPAEPDFKKIDELLYRIRSENMHKLQK